MSKELYLQAIEALRQRVAAAGEGELEAIEEEFPVSDFVELFDGSIDDYIEAKLENEAEVEPDEALDLISDEAETWLLAALFKLAWLKHNRNQLKQEILEALADPASRWGETPETEAEWRRRKGPEPGETYILVGPHGIRGVTAPDDDPDSPPADDSRPDAPGADAWDWVAVGSDDVFWEDDDGDLDEEDDDPDYDDAYGDDLLEDEKWQEADRRYEEDRLAELERLRDEIDEEEEEDYGD